MRLILERTTNFIMCGERHPFMGDYHVAYDADGTIKGLSVDFKSDGGNTYDVSFPVMDLAQLNGDNSYQIDTVVRNWRERWSEVWELIVELAYVNRINLSAEARYKTPHYSAVDIAHPFGTCFFYYTYSVAVSEVEIDVLTGEFTILRADILFDIGKSLNPLIDVGQIEGGFVQGIGHMTTEELLYQGATKHHAQAIPGEVSPLPAPGAMYNPYSTDSAA